MKKIVVPTDFSQEAENATEMAIMIAEKLKASIVLVYVIEQPSTSSFSISGEVLSNNDWEDKLYIRKLMEMAKTKLQRAVEKIRTNNLEATYHIRIGNTFHGIQSIIVEESATLIVMGTHGHSALDEFFVGSTTEKVIRHADCPVLAVKHKPTSNLCKTIAFPISVDGSEKQTPHLIHEIQKVFGAALHLVWINTPENFLTNEKSMEQLQKFANEKQLNNYSLHVYNDQHVEEGVLNFAESIHADLIAMMTTKHRGLANMFGGGIRKTVGHHTSKPMLTWLVD
jgi:nucleotide-binding universal stress UspA family protein